MFSQIEIAGRMYRYSEARRPSGKPEVIEFLNDRGVWRTLRNVNMIWEVWGRANGHLVEAA